MVTKAEGGGGGGRRKNEGMGLKGRSEESFERQDLKERILDIFILKRFVIFLFSCFFSFALFLSVWRSE